MRIEKCRVPVELKDEMIAEGKKLGPLEIKGDGSLTYEFFLQVSIIQYKYTHKMIDEQ